MLTRGCYYSHRASTLAHARDPALLEPFHRGSRGPQRLRRRELDAPHRRRPLALSIASRPRKRGVRRGSPLVRRGRAAAQAAVTRPTGSPPSPAGRRDVVSNSRRSQVSKMSMRRSERVWRPTTNQCPNPVGCPIRERRGELAGPEGHRRPASPRRGRRPAPRSRRRGTATRRNRPGPRPEAPRRDRWARARYPSAAPSRGRGITGTRRDVRGGAQALQHRRTAHREDVLIAELARDHVAPLPSAEADADVDVGSRSDRRSPPSRRRGCGSRG